MDLSIIQRVRARWRHFMGQDSEELNAEEMQRAAEEAEVEYRMALQEMQSQRGRFDTRTSPPSQPPIPYTLDDIERQLDDQDRMVREALNDFEEHER